MYIIGLGTITGHDGEINEGHCHTSYGINRTVVRWTTILFMDYLHLKCYGT